MRVVLWTVPCLTRSSLKRFCFNIPLLDGHKFHPHSKPTDTWKSYRYYVHHWCSLQPHRSIPATLNDRRQTTAPLSSRTECGETWGKIRRCAKESPICGVFATIGVDSSDSVLALVIASFFPPLILLEGCPGSHARHCIQKYQHRCRLRTALATVV